TKRSIHTVDADCSHRVVNLELVFDEVNTGNKDYTSDDPYSYCAKAGDESAWRRDGNQSSKHAVRHQPEIRFAKPSLGNNHCRKRTASRSEHCVDGNNGYAQVCTGQRRTSIEAKPAEGQNEHTENCHRHVVTWNSVDLSIFAVFADSWSKDNRACESRDTSYHVHYRRAGEVDVTVP